MHRTASSELGIADRWIRSRLHHAVREVHDGFATYRLDLVAQTLYEFAWHEFCDWYLELTKAVLTDPDADAAALNAARATLVETLGGAAEAAASVDTVRYGGAVACPL